MVVKEHYGKKWGENLKLRQYIYIYCLVYKNSRMDQGDMRGNIAIVAMTEIISRSLVLLLPARLDSSSSSSLIYSINR